MPEELVELTPLEERALQAYDFAAGLAISAMVMKLVEEDRACEKEAAAIEKNTVRHRELMARWKVCEQQLSIISATSAMMGVGA